MAKLSVELLGAVTIRLDGKLVSFASRKAEAIFIYLICQQRPFSRESLAYIFWDESNPAQAMANLRKTLTDLRKNVDEFLSISRQTVAFQGGDYSLDVEMFEQVMSSQSSISNFQTAVSLYFGDFLQGFYLRDSLQFDEWALLRREQLRLKVMTALYDLITHQLHYRQYEAGIQHATRLLALDSLNESAQRMMMRLQARAGQRSLALTQYAKCKQSLEEDLGVEPTVETTAVFNRIRSAPERPYGMPLSYTAFIGREDEQAEFSQLLDDPTCRLLTLKGQGGVGKTRLAQQVAQQVMTDYLHGVAFISVAGVESEAALVPTIADAVQLSLAGASPPAQQLLAYLQQREMLLLLDNCETLLTPHLKSSLRLINDIVRQCPNVKILATSRERFNFRVERVVAVTGLQYETAASQAEALFVECARQVWPTFKLTEANQTQVNQICQLAEGLPLAIELAAAAIATHPIDEIVTQIEQNVDFLGQQWEMSERHSSLRAVFAGAWERLTVNEQRAFKKLSVFRGPFGLNTAVIITNAAPTTLLSLADKSMLRVTQLGRYQMHQLLRQFAQEKLSPEEVQLVQAQHLIHFANFLYQREEFLHSEQQGEVLDEINRVMEDVRAAWYFGVAQLAETAVNQLLEMLFQVYQIRSWFQEGERVFGEAIRAFDNNYGIKGRLLVRRGSILFRLGRYEDARVDLETAVTIFQNLDDEFELAFAYNGLGHALHYLRQQDRSQELYEQSLALNRKIGNEQGQMRALNSLGVAQRMRGDYEASEAALREGLAISERLHDRWIKSMLLNNLGVLFRMQGEYETAKTNYQESLVLKREIGDKRGIAISLNNLGNIAQALYQLDESQLYHEESLEICQAIGDPLGVARSYNNLGHVAFDLANFEQAREWHQKSLEMKEAINDQRGMIHSFHHLARVALKLEELELAKAYLRQAFQLAQAMQAIPLMMDIFVSWGVLLMKRNEITEAMDFLHYAVHHASATKYTVQHGQRWLDEIGAGKTAVSTQTLDQLAQKILID